MLIKFNKEREIGDRLTILGGHDVLPLAEYVLNTDGCDAVFCSCGVVNLYGYDIKKEDGLPEDEEVPIDWACSMNIFRKSIDIKESPIGFQPVAQFLSEHLTEQDWYLLLIEYLAVKGFEADRAITENPASALIEAQKGYVTSEDMH